MARGRPLKYRWDTLKLKGKSLFIPSKTYQQIAPLVRSYGITHKRKFRIASVDGGITVRRIA